MRAGRLQHLRLKIASARTWSLLTVLVLASLGYGAAITAEIDRAPNNPGAKPSPGASKLWAMRSPSRVPGRFTVVFTSAAKSKASSSSASLEGFGRDLAARHGGTVVSWYDTTQTMVLEGLSDAQAAELARDPSVAIVEAVQPVRMRQAAPPTVQSPTEWHLDRIDQRALPLDNRYSFTTNGAGVNVYIVDTGINTASTTRFGGRVIQGYVPTGPDDCLNHGTRVAGLVGAAGYGVAQGATLWSVKASTNCIDSEDSSLADPASVEAALNWVRVNHVKPAVVNLSIGPDGTSRVIDDAVRALLNAGVHVVAAAGNAFDDACGYAPNAVPGVISVGATNQEDVFLLNLFLGGGSNFGNCVDILAPGSNLITVGAQTDSHGAIGTSFAAPLVTGAVARYLQTNPQASVRSVTRALLDSATKNVVQRVPEGTPNLLLYTNGVVTPPAPPGGGGGGGGEAPPLHQSQFEGQADGWTQGTPTPTAFSPSRLAVQGNCTQGRFISGTPAKMVDGDVTTQPQGGASGSSGAFYTGANSQPSNGDVDGGTCEALSPIINAREHSAVEVSLSYFHGQATSGDDRADGFTIEVLNNGVVVQTLVDIGDVKTNAVWTNVTTTVNFPGQIQVRVRITDGTADADNIEGGVDNVTVTPAVARVNLGYTADFEAGHDGWYRGVGTCRTGHFIAGTPIAASSLGVLTQPAGGAGGSSGAYFTAQNPNGAGTEHDVDGGSCVAYSPVVVVPPGQSSTEVKFSYFHGQRDSDDRFDRFEIHLLQDGAFLRKLVDLSDGTRTAAWTEFSTGAHDAQTLQLKVIVSDPDSSGGGDDVIEGGIDKVSFLPVGRCAQTFTGTLAQGAEGGHRLDSALWFGVNVLAAELTGPAGTNFNLYLQEGTWGASPASPRWTTVRSAEGSASAEAITFNNPHKVGVVGYRWLVKARRGGGSYTLCHLR